MAQQPKTQVVTKAKAALPVDINQMFAAEVAGVSKRIHQPSGQWIKVQGKQFILPDGRTFPQLEAIVVDFICANNYYTTAYQEGANTSPACFALGFDVADLKPSKAVPEPCAEECVSCPNKVWGTHPNGRGGKACDDNRNLVVMEVDPKTGESRLYLLKVSKTAIQKPAASKVRSGEPTWFDNYVNEIASTFNRPLRGVLTRITFDSASDYPTMRFSCLGAADNGLILEAQSKLEEARRMLQVEPQVASDEEVVERPKKPAARGRR